MKLAEAKRKMSSVIREVKVSWAKLLAGALVERGDFVLNL